jgi:hypothetical protein
MMAKITKKVLANGLPTSGKRQEIGISCFNYEGLDQWESSVEKGGMICFGLNIWRNLKRLRGPVRKAE